jgi:hypothetical protein
MISLPAELDDRMSQHDAINWSAVAVTAFEIELGRLAQERKSLDMKDVIDRLRASKIEAETEDYRGGYAIGEEWAKNHAEVRDLRNLDTCRAETKDWRYAWETAEGDRLTGGERLAAAMLGGIANCDRPELDQLWEANFGARCTARDGEFVRGVADGALAVWDAVKGQL